MSEYLPNPDCSMCQGVGEYKHGGSKDANVTCSCVRDQWRKEFRDRAQKVIQDTKNHFGCDTCSHYEFRQYWHICHRHERLVSQIQECGRMAKNEQLSLLERRAS